MEQVHWHICMSFSPWSYATFRKWEQDSIANAPYITDYFVEWKFGVAAFAFHRKGGYEYGLILRATFEEEGARFPPNVTEERKYAIINSKYVGAPTPGW